MIRQPAVWTDEDAARLRAVRAYLGHSQVQCADALRALGATVGQGAISGWETTKHVPHPDAIAAIARYCERVVLPGTGPAAAGPGASDGDGRRQFDSVIGSITGERLLSDRQAAAIDGLIKRIANGPPLSKRDGPAVQAMLKLLALDDEVGGGR